MWSMNMILALRAVIVFSLLLVGVKQVGAVPIESVLIVAVLFAALACIVLILLRSRFYWSALGLMMQACILVVLIFSQGEDWISVGLLLVATLLSSMLLLLCYRWRRVEVQSWRRTYGVPDESGFVLHLNRLGSLELGRVNLPWRMIFDGVEVRDVSGKKVDF